MLFKVLQEPFNVGEVAGQTFGKEQLAIDGDLERSAMRFNQSQVCGEPVFQFGRQTGGQGTVISLCAVFYGDIKAFHFIAISQVESLRAVAVIRACGSGSSW